MSGVFPAIVERYFETNRIVAADTNNNADQYVYTHANGINIVGLAPSHPVLREQKQVSSVSFDVGPRAGGGGGGGKKRGGKEVRVEPTEIVAQLTCTDGSTYPVRALVRGQLVEVNEELRKQPNLITQSAALRGWVVIIFAPVTASRDASVASRNHTSTTTTTAANPSEPT